MSEENTPQPEPQKSKSNKYRDLILGVLMLGYGGYKIYSHTGSTIQLVLAISILGFGGFHIYRGIKAS
jgi:hypothetical protein